MASVVRWLTAPDTQPRTPDHVNEARIQLVRRHDNNTSLSTSSSDALTHARRDGVTYASKDHKRGVQFFAHLPAGSDLAESAQKIAGGMFSGKATEERVPVTSERMLENTNDRHWRVRDERDDASESTSRAPEMSAEEVVLVQEDVRSVRSVGEKSSVPSRHAPSSVGNVQTFDSARTPRAASRPQAKVFRHQSSSHVTYNIRDRHAGRQLFVSAPVGSWEAEVHEQVAAKAASSATVGLRLDKPFLMHNSFVLTESGCTDWGRRK
jgi:hypothetical protein